MADNALGGFLRARREAITPAQAGLPTGPRRRTPGLRREELAELAGISVEYLTRLERGTDRYPSAQVLGALADVLRCTEEERVHLYRLVKAGSGMQCGQHAEQELRPTVHALLDRLDPAPALVHNAQGDVLAGTAGFQRLAKDTGLLDGQPPNLHRYVFTDARARSLFADWERVAAEHAAALRAAVDLGDPAAAGLAAELEILLGKEFSRRLAATAVLPAWTGEQRWAHPRVGELRLAYETLPLPETEECRLVVYLAADSATAEALV